MFRTTFVSAFALAVTASALPAHATVDAFMELNVPYRELQTDDVCFMKSKMWAVIGIPQGSVMNGAFRPVYVFQDQNRTAFPYVNVNVLATTPALVPSYVSDSWAGTVVEYRMKLDVTKYAVANGTTLAGRTKTITTAKLAVLAMARNLARMGSAYRLWITFVGLPSQTGIVGTKLYATTSSAYTASSTLLAAYERELVNRSRSCR
jgi:hypothetical protein